MVIAVRSAEAIPGFAAVYGAEEAGVGDVDAIRIFRVGPDVREIPSALAEAVVVGDERPVGAAVVAAVEAAFFGFDECVDDVRIGAGNGNADAAERAFGNAVALKTLPSGAVIVRTVEAVLGATAVESPGSAPAFPHGGEKNVRILRVENDVDGAGAVVKIENFFPGFAAVPSAEDAALRVRAVSVAKSGNESDVGIRWMNDDGPNVARVFEADVGPGLASVSGFVNAIAEGDVAADAGFAAADVYDVGIGVGNRDGANRRGGGLLIEERVPGDAAVGGFPDAAGDRAEVVGVRLAGDAGDGDGAAAAEGADEAPLHAAIRLGIDLRGGLLGVGD